MKLAVSTFVYPHFRKTFTFLYRTSNSIRPNIVPVRMNLSFAVSRNILPICETKSFKNLNVLLQGSRVSDDDYYWIILRDAAPVKLEVDMALHDSSRSKRVPFMVFFKLNLMIFSRILNNSLFGMRRSTLRMGRRTCLLPDSDKEISLLTQSVGGEMMHRSSPTQNITACRSSHTQGATVPLNCLCL